MNLIDKNQYMFSSELPPACKVLYDTIVNSELDMEYEMGLMEYKLSDAIRSVEWKIYYWGYLIVFTGTA